MSEPIPNRGPLAYRFVVALLRLMVSLFFRQVEVVGLDHVPRRGGGLILAWHPNGLVDPALILTRFPRRVVFGARHGLFRWPLLGRLMRSVGTVPIFRPQDPWAGGDDEARRQANRRSLQALAEAIASGSFAALFPEGVSHDEPFLRELKTGAARLYYQAARLLPSGSPQPAILPVGLHYDKKRIFGSKVLVEFHPPLDLAEELAEPVGEEAPRETQRAQVEALTAELERDLRTVVHATENWEFHFLMHRARSLIRAERARRAGSTLGAPNMAERVLGFARLWSGYEIRRGTHPKEAAKLKNGVREYGERLKALGLRDHELDAAPSWRSPRAALLLLAQALAVYLLLPPLLLVGWVVNLPTALAVSAVARSASQALKDEASVKILLGTIAFPLTWLVAGLLVAGGQLWLAAFFPEVPGSALLTGVVAFALSGLGGWVALEYQRLLGETYRALKVRFTRVRRKHEVERLLAERARLHDELTELAAGLELPGRVAPDGRVIAAGEPAGG